MTKEYGCKRQGIKPSVINDTGTLLLVVKLMCFVDLYQVTHKGTQRLHLNKIRCKIPFLKSREREKENLGFGGRLNAAIQSNAWQFPLT